MKMTRGARRAFSGITAAMVLSASMPAAAQDTVTTTYKYDALGRLTDAQDNCTGREVKTVYTYDKAGNRTNVTTTGAPGCGRSGFVVVPLNGFTIIPIG